MKKIIFSVLAVLVVVAAIFYLVSKKNASPEQAAPAVAAGPSNDLPWLSLTQLDGTRLTAHSLEGKTILVFFQPDCDHCQRETKQIREHIDAFKDYNVYFVSDATIPQLSKFAVEYELAASNNVHFTHATPDDIYNAVGGIQVPAVFVFSDKGHLIKSFIGETPIEQILHYL
ncbi:redoxin domain-containing protein [Pontibacter sp. 172403-2]|uniref:TlpA family protein disulfide reductase n=1 Tax=Pontibacter rufus TaxID=2791028 RepID=UPI0018B016CC|nr:redoxin domain-containing protein [Pontibacter sp. 172403-2]MBF9252303.1 redoxin domain-containing protein [Pontibacter sp. 172403-2]